MSNIFDIIRRAESLRDEKALNSISPERVGGIMTDTLKYLNDFQLSSGSLGLDKTYTSISAMNADTEPVSDITGKPLKAGQLAVIVPTVESDPDAGKVYRYNSPGDWTYIQTIGNIIADKELSETSENPIQNSTVTRLVTEYNVSNHFPTDGIDGTNRYTLETAIAKIPASLRTVGIKCSFLNEAGQVETWQCNGGGIDDLDNWYNIGASKITELGLGLYAISGREFDIDAAPVQSYDNNGIWYTTGKDYLGLYMDVIPGLTIILKSSATQRAYYSFVKERGTVNGSEVRYAEDGGKKYSIPADSMLDVTVPAGARFLWVQIQSGSESNKPSRIYIKGAQEDYVPKDRIIDDVTTGGKENVLSAGQGKVLNEKIERNTASLVSMKSQLGTDYNIDSLVQEACYPNDDTDPDLWYIGNASYKGAFIAAVPKADYRITGNSSASTRICFVKERGTVNGEPVVYATGSKLEEAIPWGQTATYTAPSDAVYLWVSGGSRIPQRIELIGKVLSRESIVDNLNGGADKVLSAEQGKVLNEKMERIAGYNYAIDDITVVAHYLDATEWLIGNTGYTGCYISVRGGDIFDITASDNHNTIYAFLKSQGINNGEAADFAEGYAKTDIISPGMAAKVEVPKDALYLWVCVKYNNEDRFPSRLFMEGIQEGESYDDFRLPALTENPLERLRKDGGFARIFKDWGFIGDSMTSGNHNYYLADGENSGGDIFEYSWGEYIKQILGCAGFEYSSGGWTCRDWIDATNGRGWDKLQTEKRQVYTIALGCNEADPSISYPLGSPDDIKDDYNENADSFYGNYAGIIQRVKSIQRKAVIFCITLPRGDRSAAETYNAAIRHMAEKFSNVYIIDLWRHAPAVNAEWSSAFRLQYHLNAMGYLYTAWEVLTYIDWTIRRNPLYFRDVAFIGDENKFADENADVYGNNGL